MRTYGPFNASSSPSLTAGTAIQVIVDPGTVAIQVQNDTPYRVYVQFDGSRPTSASALGSNYNGVAGPWGHPVIPVNVGGLNQGGSTFYGVIWLFPVDLSGSLATTGMASTLAEIHVDGYGYGEELPQAWAAPRQQDLTSQPRTIIVPTSAGSGGVQTGRVTTPAPGASVNLYTGWSVAGQTGTGNVFSFYVYSVYVTPGFNAAGAGGMDVSIQIDLQNAANVSLGFPWPQEFIRASLFWTAAAGPYSYINWPPVPWPAVFTGSLGGGFATADHIAIVLKNAGSTNAPAQFDFTIMSYIGPFGSNNTVQIPGPIGKPSSQGNLL